MKTSLTVAVLSLLILTPSAGFAQAKAKPGQKEAPKPFSAPPPGRSELRPRVEALLGGYEFEPSKQDWQRLGPDALNVLVAIANDDKQLPSRRARAIASMIHFEGPAVSANLATFTDSKTLPMTLRATAAEVLIARDGEKALSRVSPLLSATDPRVRETVAKSLGRLGSADARKTLASRLEKEQDPAVREAIQQGLAPSR